jgi:hypothetical protein
MEPPVCSRSIIAGTDHRALFPRRHDLDAEFLDEMKRTGALQHLIDGAGIRRESGDDTTGSLQDDSI